MKKVTSITREEVYTIIRAYRTSRARAQIIKRIAETLKERLKEIPEFE